MEVYSWYIRPKLNILSRSKNGGYRPKSHIHNFRPYMYICMLLIHLNSVHLRIKSSVCVIDAIEAHSCTELIPEFWWVNSSLTQTGSEHRTFRLKSLCQLLTVSCLVIIMNVCVVVLTESIATYGWPSFEWFCQSVDNSNVCSTHPTHRQVFVYIVWKLCVSTLYKLHMILSLSCDCPSFEWFFPSAGTSNVCQKASFAALNHLIYYLRPIHPYTQDFIMCEISVCPLYTSFACYCLLRLLLQHHQAGMLNLMLMTVTRYNSKVSLPRMWIRNA